MEWVKLFLAKLPILYPMKPPETLWFSGIFRGYKIETLARNGLKIYGDPICPRILIKYFYYKKLYISRPKFFTALFAMPV